MTAGASKLAALLRTGRQLPELPLVLLGVWLVAQVLPRTLLSAPLVALADRVARLLGVDSAAMVWSSGALVAGSLALVTVAMAARWIADRVTGYERGRQVTLGDAIVAITLLALADPLLSTMPHYSFGEVIWRLKCGLAMLSVMLYLDTRQAVRLAWWILALLTVQALAALVLYALDVHQYHSQVFIRRAGGTYRSPNQLYVVALVTTALGWGLLRSADTGAQRLLCRTALASGAAALLLTFQRGGWLGAIPLLWLPVLNPATSARPSRGLVPKLLVASVVILLAVGLVRTKGHPIGNPGDRSFWGRTAIWSVAWSAVRERPWLGYGLGSYPMVQRDRMTAELKGFNPENGEPKNLVLSVWIEQGLAGCLLVAWAVCGLGRIRQCGVRGPAASSPAWLLLAIQAAAVAVAVGGLFDTPVLHSSRGSASALLAVLLALAVPLARSPRAAAAGGTVGGPHHRPRLAAFT